MLRSKNINIIKVKDDILKRSYSQLIII